MKMAMKELKIQLGAKYKALAGLTGALVVLVLAARFLYVPAMARVSRNRAALQDLKVTQIDRTLLQNAPVILWKIAAHDGHERHRRKETGGVRKIGGGAAENAIALSERGFHGINRDRSDHSQRIGGNFV